MKAELKIKCTLKEIEALEIVEGILEEIEESVSNIIEDFKTQALDDAKNLIRNITFYAEEEKEKEKEGE